MSIQKTTKKKVRKNHVDKASLWNTFDEEVKHEKPIECVYRKNGEREKCELCEYSYNIGLL